jgi:hypothetical protein
MYSSTSGWIVGYVRMESNSASVNTQLGVNAIVETLGFQTTRVGCENLFEQVGKLYCPLMTVEARSA